MSASHAPVLDAIAMQLVAALDRYEGDVGTMLETWLDMERYRAVSAQVEEIRLYSATLPQVSVPWVELLIAHAELVHCLWRQQFDSPESHLAACSDLRARHGECIASMRARCLGFVARSHA